MKLAILAISIMLLVSGCHRAKYYRQDVEGGYTYWREYHQTTFHGLCANLYGNDTGSYWEVDHPSGHRKNMDGSVGSAITEKRLFDSKAEAEAWAESVCPTGEKKGGS